MRVALGATRAQILRLMLGMVCASLSPAVLGPVPHLLTGTLTGLGTIDAADPVALVSLPCCGPQLDSLRLSARGRATSMSPDRASEDDADP